MLIISFYSNSSLCSSLCSSAALENRTILVAYLGIDFCLFLGLKVVRGDFLYWLAVESVPMRFIISCLVRTTIKIMVDFAGVMHVRHPYELGGIYFTTILLTTPIICLYFGSRYLTYVEDEEVKKSLSYVFSREQVYGGLGALACLQFFSFTTLLMCVIPATYRRTLWSTETGEQLRGAKRRVTTTMITAAIRLR